MIQCHNHEFEPIGRKLILQHLMTIEKEIRDYCLYLIKKENPWISITVDHWTSISSKNYTGMTAHWISSEYKMISIPLGCWLHQGDSEAKTLVDDFAVKLFKECGFIDAKIVAVVSDTTSNMNKFGELLEERNLPHIYCTDHVLQLSAKLAFEDKNFKRAEQSVYVYQQTENVENRSCLVMKKSRRIVEIFSCSTQNMDKLICTQTEGGCIQSILILYPQYLR